MQIANLFSHVSFGGGGEGRESGTDRYENAGAQHPSGYSEGTPRRDTTTNERIIGAAVGNMVGRYVSGGNGYAAAAGAAVGAIATGGANVGGPSPAIPDFTAP